MYRLRCGWKRVCSATSIISVSAFVLAGCATTASLTRSEPVIVSSAEPAPVQTVHLTSADADMIIARAIAEHEMRRP